MARLGQRCLDSLTRGWTYDLSQRTVAIMSPHSAAWARSSGCWPPRQPRRSCSTAASSGRSNDAQGAVVPGARVVIVNTDTNFTREATTDAQGAYSFTNIQAGPYTVRVVAAGIPRGRPVRRAGHGRADQPGRPHAAGRRDERDGHRPVRGRAPADRQGGRPHRAQVQRDHESAAQSLPELSGARRPGAGLAAAGIPECRNRHAAAVAEHDGERPGWRGQHHAHRRHPERQRRPAAPQRLHSTGRDDRVGQHHDEQHGC